MFHPQSISATWMQQLESSSSAMRGTLPQTEIIFLRFFTCRWRSRRFPSSWLCLRGLHTGRACARLRYTGTPDTACPISPGAWPWGQIRDVFLKVANRRVALAAWLPPLLASLLLPCSCLPWEGGKKPFTITGTFEPSSSKPEALLCSPANFGPVFDCLSRGMSGGVGVTKAFPAHPASEPRVGERRWGCPLDRDRLERSGTCAAIS